MRRTVLGSTTKFRPRARLGAQTVRRSRTSRTWRRERVTPRMVPRPAGPCAHQLRRTSIMPAPRRRQLGERRRSEVDDPPGIVASRSSTVHRTDAPLATSVTVTTVPNARVGLAQCRRAPVPRRQSARAVRRRWCRGRGCHGLRGSSRDATGGTGATVVVGGAGRHHSSVRHVHDVGLHTARRGRRGRWRRGHRRHRHLRLRVHIRVHIRLRCRGDQAGEPDRSGPGLGQARQRTVGATEMGTGMVP